MECKVMKKVTLMMALVCIVAMCLSLGACQKRVGPTKITIQDSVRRYYPILQGQDLKMRWKVTNRGEVPLVLTDVQPCCGSMEVMTEYNDLIPPGKDIDLIIVLHSLKHTGETNLTIRIFGNIEPNGVDSMMFTVNVVPPYGGTPDYEQLYKENLDNMDEAMKEAINGSEDERGYFTKDEENDSRYRENDSPNF